MRIDHLRIENFKCFQEKEFHFNPHFNLLVGENGSGKTTALDALAISLATWLLGFRSRLDKRGIEPGEPTLLAQELGGKTVFLEQYPVTVRTSGAVGERPLGWTRSKDSEGGKTRFGDALELIGLAREADTKLRQKGADQPVLPLIAYYGTMRLWQEPRKLKQESRVSGNEFAEDKRKLSPLEGYRFSVDPRISIKALVKWFARQAWIGFQRGSEPMGSMVIRQAILSCIEGAEDLYFDAERGELIVDIAGHGPLPFDGLSDGQRSTVALIADIAQKAEQLNSHFGERFLRDTPGVVLIDELDLHLHPIWQRRIIGDLRRTFPGLQFICTTHSPFLIQSLPPEGQLIQLGGSGGLDRTDSSIEDIAEAIQGVPMPQKSKRYLDMVAAAEAYFRLLREGRPADSQELADTKRRLDELSLPFSDDPAFQALLKMERLAAFGAKD